MPPLSHDKVNAFITLDDFSPGIHSEWYATSGAQAAPDGAAQLNGTYGCVASAHGALMPAPLKVQSLTQFPADPVSTKYMPGHQEMAVMAFRNMSPIQAGNTVPATAAPPYPDMPWFVYQYWNGIANVLFRGYKVYQVVNPPLAAVTLSSIGTVSQTGNIIQAAGGAYGFGGIDFVRSNTTTPANPGNVIAVLASSYADGDYANSTVSVFPTNAAPTTDAFATPTFSAQFAPATVFAHQDRIFKLSSTPFNNFSSVGASGSMNASELFDYTATNNYSAGSGVTAGSVIVEENPTGYGSWCSMNANSLFLIKQVGGAVIVRGDITTPTVTRMPGVASTGEAVNIGARLPSGEYVYGSNRGVWSWHGGDTSRLISPQLNGWFWQVPGLQVPLGSAGAVTWSHPGTKGSFGYSDPFLFAPNNFLYDSRHKSWWRYSNPASTIYGWHDVSANGNILSAPLFVTFQNPEACAWWDLNQGQSYYQWISQPLQRSLGRILNIREMDVTLIGNGTVTFKLQGLSEQAPVTETFQINSTTPVTRNFATDIECMDAILTIISTAAGTGPAPTVFRVTLGYYDDRPARGGA